MNKKCTILFIVSLTLLGILSYLVIQLLPQPNNQYKSFVVSGNVHPSETIVGNQAQYVYVFYPFNPDYLCRSSNIQRTKIKWLDNASGKYTVSFNVPVGLNEVILTTDCASCDYTNVDLETDTSQIDLIWGSGTCGNGFQVKEDRKELITHARNFLNGIETNIVDKPFNSSEIQSIKSDIKRGRDAIFESESTRDANESLLQAYYAEWFAWRAQYKMDLYDLGYCTEKVGLLLESHEKDSCYIPDHKAFEDFSSVNRSYSSLKERLLKNSPYDKKDPEKMKNEIRYLHNQFEFVTDSKYKCENSLNVINRTFEFQKPYCDARKNIISISYIISLIVVFYSGIFIGILIGKGRKKWTK